MEFIKTGKFANIEIGQSRKWISENFPKPDDMSRMFKGCYIWRYGVFEFHFFDGKLLTLWCDHLDYLNNPNKKQFRFNKWIFNKQTLNLKSFKKALKKEGIEYILFKNEAMKREDGSLFSFTMQIKDSNSIIHFEAIDDTETDIEYYELIAIGAVNSMQQNLEILEYIEP